MKKAYLQLQPNFSESTFQGVWNDMIKKFRGRTCHYFFFWKESNPLEKKLGRSECSQRKDIVDLFGKMSVKNSSYQKKIDIII